MDKAKIISVNPADWTRGEAALRNQKTAASRVAVLTKMVRTHKKSNFVDFITGISKDTNRSASSKLLLVRLLCGAIFITAAAMGLANGMPHSLSAATLAVGISIVSGFATRIATLGGALFFGIECHSLFIAEMMPDAVLAGAFAAVALLLAVLGPGLYSVDQLIRRLVKGRHAPRIQRPDKQRPLTYRAYWN